MATIAPSLKALAESKTDGIQKATYFKIRPDLVEFEEGFNLRDEGPELAEHLEAMYQAMKAGAYFPPIDVSVIDGRVIVRDGHCRTRTARRLMSEGFDYMLEARQLRGNEADATLHMLGSDRGKAFSPLQQARGFLRLINYGMDVSAIAGRLGISRSTVENGLALVDAPVPVQNMIAAGEVSASVARKALKKHGSAATGVLTAAVNTAKASGKTKATAKHVEPVKADKIAIRAFVERVAQLDSKGGSTYASATLAQLIADARALVGMP